MLRRVPFTALQAHSYHFSTSRLCADRAIIYTKNGDPAQVLSAATYPSLPPPSRNTVNIKFLLSPVNPADINVIEGVYPSKPGSSVLFSAEGADKPTFIGGNEGLAEVTEVGSVAEDTLKRGDWVVMTKPQSGTWASTKNVDISDVLKLPRQPGVSEVYGATMTVNPPTAFNMLHDFTELREGDWIVQNGANSAVGQAVIQIAAWRGVRTINFVRNRDNLDKLVNKLKSLGATEVLTYDDFSDKGLRSRIKGWTAGKDIKLGLNCVGGKETSLMARFLGADAHLVSYGAMSKQPLSLPTSLFIFKNLTSHGFWQTRWYEQHNRADKQRLINILVKLASEGKLKEPEHEILSIPADVSDEEAGQQVRDIFGKIQQGHYGKKVLLRLD